MKTTSITVERNFHIMNDDKFIMEKISVTKELEQFDNVNAAIDQAREDISYNFKLHYPKVETSLNFDVVRQLDKEERNFYEVGKITQADIDKRLEALEIIPEKIKPVPIEDQIQACKTVEELKSFEILAGMNPKLQLTYHNKWKELTAKEELISSIKIEIKKKEIDSIMEITNALSESSFNGMKKAYNKK